MHTKWSLQTSPQGAKLHHNYKSRKDAIFTCISAFNLEAIFNASLPDDVVFFTQEFGNMDQTVFQKFYDTLNLLTPDDLKEVSLSVISAMNVSLLNN